MPQLAKDGKVNPRTIRRTVHSHNLSPHERTSKYLIVICKFKATKLQKVKDAYASRNLLPKTAKNAQNLYKVSFFAIFCLSKDDTVSG